MTEPVGGGPELDGHEGVTGGRPVEAVAVGQDLVDRRLAHDLGQVLVHQQPLVVPQGDLTGDEESDVAVGPVAAARRREGVEPVAVELVEEPVVEKDVGAVQAGDDDVLVVAGIADNGAGTYPSGFATRGTSSWTPPVPMRSLGPAVPSRLATYRSGRSPGPPPNTESRSSAGVRVLGEISGFCGTPRVEVWSKVMS